MTLAKTDARLLATSGASDIVRARCRHARELAGNGGGGGAVVAIEPGEWEMAMRVANVRMDNMPPEMRGEMGRMRNNETRTARESA